MIKSPPSKVISSSSEQKTKLQKEKPLPLDDKKRSISSRDDSIKIKQEEPLSKHHKYVSEDFSSPANKSSAEDVASSKQVNTSNNTLKLSATKRSISLEEDTNEITVSKHPKLDKETAYTTAKRVNTMMPTQKLTKASSQSEILTSSKTPVILDKNSEVHSDKLDESLIEKADFETLCKFIQLISEHDKSGA